MGLNKNEIERVKQIMRELRNKNISAETYMELLDELDKLFDKLFKK